jgi:anti-sigma factor RsiW
MCHGMTEQQWLAYLDGGLDVTEYARMRDHASTCAECAGTLRELSLWRERLVEAAALVRTAVETLPGDVDRLLAVSIQRIRACEPGARRSDPRWSFKEAVMLLRLLVEPFCGPGTAGAAISLAVRRSTVADAQSDAPAVWNLFVSNMSEMISSVCGTEAGRLVNQVGVCLDVANA